MSVPGATPPAPVEDAALAIRGRRGLARFARPHRRGRLDLPAQAVASALLLAFLLRLDWLFGLYLASPLERAMLPGSPRVPMLAGLAGLVSGLLLRPLGGVLLGWRSDRIDRAGTLRLLAWIMAGGSVLIGAVPGYGTVGMLAPAAALLGRAAQGVATGGALACTLSLLVEAAPAGRRYAYAGLLAAAILLASVVAGWIGIELSLSLSEAALAAWGWRLPFLAGVLLGPLAAWLLRPLGAPPAADRPARLPPALAAGVGLLLAGAALTYFWRGYAPLWVTARLHLPLAAALLGSGVSLLVAVVAVGIGGLLAEMFDARAVFALAAAASALAVWPLFAWLAAGADGAASVPGAARGEPAAGARRGRGAGPSRLPVPAGLARARDRGGGRGGRRLRRRRAAARPRRAASRGGVRHRPGARRRGAGGVGPGAAPSRPPPRG